MDILIIAEKHVAARKIADALDASGKARPVKHGKGGEHFEVALFDSGKPATVVYGSGHLLSLELDTKRGTPPRFDVKWTRDVKTTHSRTAIKTIEEVVRSTTFAHYVVATDYDVEGSVIGYNILRFLCGQKTVNLKQSTSTFQRMHFSSLVPDELRRAWKSRDISLDCARITAGYTRHEVDLIYGINFSSILTRLAKKGTGTFQVLSIGRVQGPVLSQVNERDEKIKNFKPKPYWEIDATLCTDDTRFQAKAKPSIFDVKEDAMKVKQDCETRSARLEKVQKRTVSRTPPPPFNLSALQHEAGRVLHFNPSRTLKIAEKLYLEALISYPRTGSEIVPPEINIKAILNDLKANDLFPEAIDRLIMAGTLAPAKGAMQDEAHPPIIPTGLGLSKVKLTSDERELFLLVVKRFLASFGPDATWERKEYELEASGHHFSHATIQHLARGWADIYPAMDMPSPTGSMDLHENQTMLVESVNIIEKKTQPAPPYSDITLLGYMERTKIGTKSTRASIIEKLKARGYITRGPLTITSLGSVVARLLGTYVPDLVSVDLTRQLEEELERIEASIQTKRNVIDGAKQGITKSYNQMLAFEDEIRKEFSDLPASEGTRERVTIGGCPSCKTGTLEVVTKHGGGRIIACSGISTKTCMITLPVTQRGKITPTGQTCKTCGYPVIQARQKGRSPWTFCSNWKKCPSVKKQEPPVKE